MTVNARRVRATPFRAADEAWEVIIDLLASGPARDELLRVAGVATSIIASEAAKDDPIIVFGNGPRVRVYCLYDKDALAADNSNEQKLPAPPADGDWGVSLPCPEEDLAWVKAALGKQSKRVTARKVGEPLEVGTNEGEGKETSATTIDKEAFLRP